MATVETLLTAEEYRLLPDNGQPTELVRGRVVALNMPAFRHGWYCNRIGRIYGNLADEHDLGWVINNDSGVIIERDPDTVRGPDVAFYSYALIPKGQFPIGYPAVAPEVVFEVRSPTDRWADILEKVAEYLRAGVLVVCVLDEATQTVTVYRPDLPHQVLGLNDELVLPEVLADVGVPVRRFFE